MRFELNENVAKTENEEKREWINKEFPGSRSMP